MEKKMETTVFLAQSLHLHRVFSPTMDEWFRELLRSPKLSTETRFRV